MSMRPSLSVQNLSPAELVHSFDGMEATVETMDTSDYDSPDHVQVSRDVHTTIEIWNRIISLANEQHVRFGSALKVPRWDSEGKATNTLFGESFEPGRIATDLEKECRRLLGYAPLIADRIYGNEDEEVTYTNVTAGVHSNGVY